MVDKEKVKELYLKNYTPNQIAKILNCKPGTIRVCIYRNFKKFKKSHDAEKLRMKEIERITRHEAKQFMSDAEFVKRNKSIYKTDEEGNIILDKSVAPVVTYDTPRRLKNENSQRALDTRIRKSGYKKENILFNS